MSIDLGRIAAFTVVSMIVGSYAAARGKRRARLMVARELSPQHQLPICNIPIEGAGRPEDAQLDAEAQQVALRSGWRAAAEVYNRAWWEAKSDKPRRKYLQRRAAAMLNAHGQEIGGDWLFWGIAAIAVAGLGYVIFAA